MVGGIYGGRWANFKFMQKLKYMKEKLKAWYLKVFGDVIVKKKELIMEIDDIDNKESKGLVFENLVARRAVAKNELELVLLREKTNWRQKSRLK